MILYTQQQLNNLQKRFNKNIICSILVVILDIVLSVILCLFANDNNAFSLQIIVSAINVCTGWYVIGSIFLATVPLSRKISFTKSMINGSKQSVNGTVVKVGETITFAKLTMVEVIIADDKSHVCYWESSDFVPFSVNDVVSLQIVNGRIFSYEVTSHE